MPLRPSREAAGWSDIGRARRGPGALPYCGAPQPKRVQTMKTLALATLALAGTLSVPALVASGASGTAPGGVSVGDEFPDFEIDSWLNFPEGASTIHDLRGRVILLDFWRTW